MDRASGNLPPGVAEGSVYDRVAPFPFPHGLPPQPPPPFPGEGLGPIVRLPNGLYGFDRFAHSDPRLAAERVPPPWERESFDQGLLEVRRSLSQERGPHAYEGGKGGSHMQERDFRLGWNDGRARSSERSPREWGRTHRGVHMRDDTRGRSPEPRRSKSPLARGMENEGVQEQRFERERQARGPSGRVGAHGRMSRTWRDRRSPSPRDRKPGAETRKDADKPFGGWKELGGRGASFSSRIVKKEVGGRLVFEESEKRSVEVLKGKLQGPEGREAKDRAWETQSWKENSRQERDERDGSRSGAERERRRDGPESSERRRRSGGQGEEGSKGESGVQAKPGKDGVTKGEAKTDTPREAREESGRKGANHLSRRRDEKEGAVGEPEKKSLTLVEAIRRERLKSELASPKRVLQKETEPSPLGGGSSLSKENQRSGATELQSPGGVASESGSGVVQSGLLPSPHEQPKLPVLTLFGQSLDPGSPRQELNLLDNLGAQPPEERTECVPPLAQTSLCLHVGTKVGSPKMGGVDGPEPFGVVESLEALLRPAPQEAPLPNLLKLKQPFLDSVKQARETADKETQTSSAHFASPSVAKQLQALQESHPLFWLCFEEMPEKDLKRADWAADFRLGWGSRESGRAAIRSGEKSGAGGIPVADQVSAEHSGPSATRTDKWAEPATWREAGGPESSHQCVPLWDDKPAQFQKPIVEPAVEQVVQLRDARVGAMRLLHANEQQIEPRPSIKLVDQQKIQKTSGEQGKHEEADQIKSLANKLERQELQAAEAAWQAESGMQEQTLHGHEKCISLQSRGGVKRGSEWLGPDESQASARMKKVAWVAGNDAIEIWPKEDEQAGTLPAEQPIAGRAISQPVLGDGQGRAADFKASGQEEEEGSASRFGLPADSLEKTPRVPNQLVLTKVEEVSRPKSPTEAAGEVGGAGCGEESWGNGDVEDLPLKALKALRSRMAADEGKRGGPVVSPHEQVDVPGVMGLARCNGADVNIARADQSDPPTSAPQVSTPVVLATNSTEQQMASGHVAEPSSEPDVGTAGVVFSELRGAEGTTGTGRSCALCGAGPSRARGEWYCATCGRRDEACACTRPLRAHVKSRIFAAKYSGAKAVVHQLCAFWTPSVYQPGDGAAFVGLTRAVIDSTGSRNSGGKKLTPVRCTYCNQVGATSRCRVESSCHSVYHYTCALAAGCRMHDCLENSGLSVACPDHFHVDCQVRRGEIAPPRQLPWAASRSGPKRPQTDPGKRSKKAGGTKRSVVKPPLTVQARKSTVRHLGGQAAVHRTEGRKHVLEAEEQGMDSGEWEGSEKGFGEPPRKRSRVSPEPGRPASELSPSCGEVSKIKPEKQSRGGGSNRGRKRGNRELMSILADVPKQKKLPSIEAQLEKQRDMLLKRQDVGKSKRAAIVEDVSLDAELLALVSELAPQVHRVMRRLVERGVDGHLDGSDGKRRVVNGEPNGRLERKAEGKGQLLGPTVGFSDRGSPGGLGQLGRVVGAAETARLLRGGPKAGGTVSQEARGNVGSPIAVSLAEALAGGSEPGCREPTVEPGEESDEGTELVEPLGPTYDDVSSDAQIDEVTEVEGKELVEVSGAVGGLDVAERSEEGPNARGTEVDGAGRAFDVTAPDAGGQARGWTETGRQEADEDESEFACAACGGAGGLSTMKPHPALPAVLCEECVESFNGANFSDRCKAGVERHCQLCGRREKVRPRCDGCCKTVCQRCLARVLGPEQQRAIADLDAWLCFSCDLAQLEGLKSDVRRFEEARVRREVWENRAGWQTPRAGAVGVGQGGIGTASRVDLQGEGQNDSGAAKEGASHGSEGRTNAALTGRTERLEERATSPLLGERRTRVEPGASRVEASASPNGQGPEVHACSWAGCGKLFPTARARNGHLSKHFRPCARREESGAGRAAAEQRLGENAGVPRSTGPGEDEVTERAESGLVEEVNGQVGNGRNRKRTGSTAERCEREDGAKGGAALMQEVQAGPRPGLAELKGGGPESVREEQRVFACAACGASRQCSQQRQHPSLPVAVCQDCSRTIESADFGGKDVRGWDRLCQVCGIESPTSERRRCESCSCAACDRCVERLLGGRMLAAIQGGAPWLCFACDSEQLEEAKTGRGGMSEEGLEPGAESSEVNKGSAADVVSVSHPNGVLMEEKGALGKRSREGGTHMGPVEVSEPWGFCQCDSCANRYTGKKDAQSPATRPLVSSPGARAPPKKSGTRPWAAYSRVGARLVHADISGGKEKVPIPFTNDVDDDVSPLEMDYITGFRLHPDLADFHERFAPADGCSGCCPDGADHPDAPLNQHVRDLEAFEGYALRTAEDDQRFDWQRERMRGRLFYDENRLLLLPPELHPTIIECNPRCPCWPDCPNSTLQRGASVHLELFKTDNGRGFGVRTREDIQRGRLIGQYVGEVITSDEANRRNSVYLFNMDHHVRSAEQQDEVYVVDGGPASSVIRYINHSCDPNLAIYSVYTDTLHPGKPLLALYAIKDIVAGTELAYDYKYGDPVQASPGSTDGHIECRCGAKNCQKWLPDPTGIKSEHQD